MVPFAQVPCRSTGMLTRPGAENAAISGTSQMVLFEQAWSPGQTSPPYTYGGICSHSALPGAAALEPNGGICERREAGVVTVHMGGLAQMTPRAFSPTSAPKEVLPHMPPYAHLVLLTQKVGFELISHLPQRVPYAHMVAYAPDSPRPAPWRPSRAQGGTTPAVAPDLRPNLFILPASPTRYRGGTLPCQPAPTHPWRICE